MNAFEKHALTHQVPDGLWLIRDPPGELLDGEILFRL